MARVLLVSDAGYPYTPSSLMPDNGLASLAGALEDAGHEVRVLDFGTVATLTRLFPRRISRKVGPLARKLFVRGETLSWLEKLKFLRAGAALDRHQSREALRIARDVAREARDLGADVLGLKLWNGDGFAGSVTMARVAREELPAIRIVGGGPQVDYFGRHILDHTDAFDALVAGEGERTFPRLVEAMADGADWRTISGVVWRDGPTIRTNAPEAIECLEELPLPVYRRDVYPALDGDQKVKIGVVDESRGCPNRCAFCIHPIKSGGKWSLKRPSRVIEEMRRVMDEVGTRCFIYSGSNTSARVAVGIAEEILREGLDVRYGCFGHVRGIARADFDLLRRSGCQAIFYGLESASERILERAFNKAQDLPLAERVLRDTIEAGIVAITSIIFPAPFEDEESRAATLDFLRRVRPDSVPVTIPGMIPGTPWERDAGKYGFEKARRKDLWEYALTYKIKLLYPPSMWKPLPYRLNGKSSKQLFRECEKFIAELEREGILTNVPHEMVLMAEAEGRGDDLKTFRDRCRAAFLGGDADAIAQMVADVNRGVLPLSQARGAAASAASGGPGDGLARSGSQAC